MTIEEKLANLEEQKGIIFEKLTELQTQINDKTSEHENQAKLYADQANLFKESSKEASDLIANNLEESNSKLEEVKALSSSIQKINNKIITFEEKSKFNSDQIDELHSEISEKVESIKIHINEIELTFETKAKLDEKLKKLEEIFNKGDEYDSKLALLNKTISDRKKEIDELYYEIIGYTDTSENGEEVYIEGLKDDLEKSFNLIKSKLDELDKNLNSFQTTTISDYEKFLQENNTKYNEHLESWNKTFTVIEKKIYDLLPRALTAGLSYAYSEKKENEVLESATLSNTFKWAIFGLVIISLIPFTVSLIYIYNSTVIEKVISRVPSLVLAILPLYIPILWVAYSSNRKMNLSKRLIEEYTHKEVLSKTFEGLSKQISDVEDKDISEDLRIKLLYNILEVNSENPGKLISDYNKSDHPLMDALDKSVKLTNAVTKLAKIPGFAKLAANLERKSQVMLNEEKTRAEAGIDSLNV